MTASRSRRVALVLLVAVAVFYGGFELGRAGAGYSIVSAMLERLELRRQVRTLGNENDSLQHRVSAAEIGQRVDRQAQSDAQRMIGDLQAETARQQQELQFYRGLVARQFGAGTLRVQELKIRPEQGRRFRVLITLVQAAARDTVVNGTVSFAIDGTRGGALVQLPLADVEPNKRRELPFSLRFFQQIEVPIELPDQFRPASLQVEYGQGRGTERSRQTFTWRVEGEPEKPVL
jgi:DNA-binding MarR family transcriptional regulator